MPLNRSYSSTAITTTTGLPCLATATGSTRARSISRPKPYLASFALNVCIQHASIGDKVIYGHFGQISNGGDLYHAGSPAELMARPNLRHGLMLYSYGRETLVSHHRTAAISRYVLFSGNCRRAAVVTHSRTNGRKHVWALQSGPSAPP